MTKRRIYGFIVLFLVFIMLFALILSYPQNVASADMGPKPQTYVKITGVPDDVLYYAAFIVPEDEGWGPHQTLDQMKAWYEKEKAELEERYADDKENPYYIEESKKYESFETYLKYFYRYDSDEGQQRVEIFLKLDEYEDVDGYSLLPDSARIFSGDKELSVTYYGPRTFKVLLYFVAEDRFVVSENCEAYAFSAYYKMDVNLNQIVEDPQAEPLPVSNNYNYTREILLLLARIVMTIAIELALAYCFKYRSKKAILTISLTNLVTQTILNVLLNVVDFKQGFLSVVFYYLFFELAAVVIEAVTYSICAKKLVFGETNKSIGKAIVYAILANVLSFGIGFVFMAFVV